MRFDNDIYPQEIMAIILSLLKQMVESYLDIEQIRSCLLSVPSVFTDGQRIAVINAAKVMELNVSSFIHDTTTIAIPDGYDSRNDEVNKLVFDVDAGTMEASILSVDDGIFEVKATAGY